MPKLIETADFLPAEWVQRIACYEPAMVPSSRRQAAVMVALAPGNNGPEVLMTQRAHTLSSHAGEVSFPGGNIETNDSSLYHTALRETREETQLQETPLYLGQLDSLYAKSGIEVAAFVSALPERPLLSPCPEEVAEIFWVPLSVLLDQPPEYQWFERQGRQWRVPFFYHDGWTIWGMTGMILVNLINVLSESRWPSFHDEWASNPMDAD